MTIKKGIKNSNGRNKIIIAVLILLAIYFCITYFIASYIVSPVASHIDISANFISSNYLDVSFKTSDNLKLTGWLFSPKSDKFVIFVPGYLDNRTNHGYYGSDLSKELINKGFGVLMYDPRARGNSEGKVRLKNEQEDVIAAVSLLKSRKIPAKNIYILSYSTGSHSTILAFDKISDIGGVILDSTPVNFKSVIDHVLTNEQHIPFIVLPGVHFWLNLFGIDLEPNNAINSLSHISKMPLLILAAKYDTSVPIADSQMIFEKSNKFSKFVLFAKGSHIETYKYNPEMYRSVVFTFLKSSK